MNTFIILFELVLPPFFSLTLTRTITIAITKTRAFSLSHPVCVCAFFCCNQNYTFDLLKYVCSKLKATFSIFRNE